MSTMPLEVTVVRVRLPRPHGQHEALVVDLCPTREAYEARRAAGRLAMPPQFVRALNAINAVMPGARVIHMAYPGRENHGV